MSYHILRSWTPPDPFAPECGCDVAPCGFVIPGNRCEQHGVTGRTIRNAHHENDCPAREDAE